MRKLVVITLAAIVAASALSSTAEARSDRGGQGRQDNDKGGRESHGKKDKKGDKVWRIRKGKQERPFFLFRGRGDCEYVRVRQSDGSLSEKVWRVCN